MAKNKNRSAEEYVLVYLLIILLISSVVLISKGVSRTVKPANPPVIQEHQE